MMKLFLSQIKDIDKIPTYLKKLGELALEDNNIVLNEALPGSTGSTTEKSIGAGFTINNGDGIDQDVTFNIISLSGISDEYSNFTGFLNRGWATELRDILVEKNSPNNPNGLRLLKEKDVLNAGSIFSGSSKNVLLLNKTLNISGEEPLFEEMNPGEIIFNIVDNKMFTKNVSGVTSTLLGNNNIVDEIPLNNHTGDTSIHFTKNSIQLSDLSSSAHTHSISEINNLENILNQKIDSETFYNYISGNTGNNFYVYEEEITKLITTSTYGNYQNFTFEVPENSLYEIKTSLLYLYASTSKNASFRAKVDDILISNITEDGWVEWELKDSKDDVRSLMNFFRVIYLEQGVHTFNLDFSTEDDKRLEMYGAKTLIKKL
jgi:hypothetical protein